MEDFNFEKSIDYKDFDEIEIYRFGNELEISGMILANGNETYLVPFADAKILEPFWLGHINMTKEDWDKLLFQLDHLEAIVRAKDEHGKLQKIIVRKSQRQVDSNISWAVFRRDDYTCQYCGRKDVPLSVDHIITWEDLGQSVEDNLITACKKCNKTRGNKSFSDWLQDDYYKKVSKWRDRNNHILMAMRDKANLLPTRKFERSR
ncbi:MAG: hypothetical protein JETCAE03_31990 [Ignavibacteriaceae bacterium]|nr:MAG: hypothetical protein JETCAE03_31990 [Ignavibacteriaceae bacterium]